MEMLKPDSKIHDQNNGYTLLDCKWIEIDKIFLGNISRLFSQNKNYANLSKMEF